jgi:hypothetical protein
MQPTDVPPITWNISEIDWPDSSSIAANIVAGHIPLMAPPSTDKMRIVLTSSLQHKDLLGLAFSLSEPHKPSNFEYACDA